MGKTGRIQVTKQTYALVKESFQFDPPRRIEVKGKGEMQVYLLSITDA